MNKLTKDMFPALQGVVPTSVATCSADGVPNVNVMSQIFYVDEEHVALSWQFFNKTWKNLQGNPKLTAIITDPAFDRLWKLRLEFQETQEKGEIFDQMDMQLQALASMTNVAVEFKIRAAVICRIISIEKIYPTGNFGIPNNITRHE